MLAFSRQMFVEFAVSQTTGTRRAKRGTVLPGARSFGTQSTWENQMSVESNLHTSQSLEARETYSLIGSDKVEGTAVYRSNGEKIGKIIRLMIGKQSGKVGYAVMSFGGFMGIGEDYHPLPWSLLTYNPRLEG
jgi:hypothetical protein